MDPIVLRTPSGSSTIDCGRGALERLGAGVAGLADASGVFVLSSPGVWTRWGAVVERSLAAWGSPRPILFDDREAAKTLRTVEKLCRVLLRAGADRGAIVVAVGGGVVGDVAGFVAACYLRGVRLVQVPTTLVAQVDSAVGGKTGVNLPEGKNLVGAFYPPQLVIVDPDLLRSLPARDFRAGVYEVIKYGVLGDPELFEYLEQHLDDVLRQRPATLDWILPRCLRAKADIVAADEREAGRREVLNLGHTFAHALEAATRYRRYRHGEAVGWGMIAATRLAAEMRLVEPDAARRIERLVLRVGTLPAFPQASPARLLARMRGDKKARAGQLRFVLPRRIGQVERVADVPETLVLRVLAGLRRAPEA